MPAPTARDFEKALTTGGAAPAVTILHGDNENLKTDLFRAVCKSIGVSPDDPFRFVRLEGEAVDVEGGRLADELGAISMFGGERLVHLRTSARLAERGIIQALDIPGDWRLVVECPDLREASWFATLVRDKRVAGIYCGEQNAGDFRAFVTEELARAGLDADAEAIDRLISLTGDDRASVRTEIMKLSALLGPEAQVSTRDIDDVVADASSMLADEVAIAAFEGECEQLARALDRMMATGSDPVQALGAAHRSALSLLRSKTRQWGSSRNEKHAPAWTAGELRSMVRSLGAAVRQTRSDSGNAGVIAERALVAIGQAARARRR